MPQDMFKRKDKMMSTLQKPNRIMSHEINHAKTQKRSKKNLISNKAPQAPRGPAIQPLN